MKAKLLILTTILLIKTSVGISQTSLHSSDGNLNGTNGHATYTMGQLFYHTNQSIGGRETQGIQQPYVLKLVTKESATKHDISCSLYPNPSANIVYLKIKGERTLESIHYEITTLSGKKIKKGRIKNIDSSIDLNTLSPSTYLILIKNKNITLKTHKLIKL